MVIKLQKRQFISKSSDQFWSCKFQWSSTPIVLCFCFVCLRLVSPMFPVSLDCPYFIAPSVFSNVYLASCNMFDTAYDST